MRQRPNVTDPQVHETDKRRFQRMRARNRFGKEYLSEIKQCVQKTDYLVNRPTPAKAQRKTVGSPTKKRTKKIEKKVNEDDLYPHVKFVIHPRIQQHKIPKFLNNQNLQQYSKTKAPVNEDQDFTKRSLSSSDQPKDRYNLSTISSTNVSDSNSSNPEVHDEVQRNSSIQNNGSNNHKNGNNSSDSFDDSAHLASLNSDKVKKEVKKRSDYSDYSDSDTTIPKKPLWKFSDSERRGKSSAISSNDFRWTKNSTINKISSSSDSDVDIEKIKEELRKDIEPEEKENQKSLNQLFFASESNENPKEDKYSLENKKENEKVSDSPINTNDKNENNDSNIVSGSNVNNVNHDLENNNKNLPNEENENKVELNEIKNTKESEIKDIPSATQEPELDSDFEDFTNANKRKVIAQNDDDIESDSDNIDDQIPNIQSRDDDQYSSDYFNKNQNSKKISPHSRVHQYSSDFNSGPQNRGTNKIYASRYSSSGDSSHAIRNEKKIQLDQQYKSHESSSDGYKFNNNNNGINQNELFIEEEEEDNDQNVHNSNNNSYVESASSQKAEKDRISPELENSLINSGNSSQKHFVETLSDGYDDDDDHNNHFVQNKIPRPQKINDSSSSSPEKEADIPVSTEGEVDNTFNYASSTSESASLMKKKQMEMDNNIDDEEDNSDIGFGNEENVFYNGKNSSSSEDYEVVEATTDTRENEIRENRKLDRRIYSGDQK